MGHVANWIGGVHIDLKSGDQSGPVFRAVPKARQKAALAFLNDNVFMTPTWLEPEAITSRLGPVTPSLETRQSNILTTLLTTARLGRMAEAEESWPSQTYPLTEYLEDLRRTVWTPVVTDAHRRSLQRVYVERLGAIVNPPAPATPAPGGFGGGGGGGQQQTAPFLTQANVPRSDMPALARSQLRAIRTQARAAAAAPGASAIARAHWADIADRVDAILEPRR